MMSELPEKVQSLIGKSSYACDADCEVSQSNVRALCATVQNANPVYWDAEQAESIVGARIAPTAMLSTWGRPERWSPTESAATKPLQLHYDLKELFGFPVAIVGSFESVFHAPVLIGDSLHTCQVLRSVSEEKDTRLGRGRFWVIEMQYHNQRDELAGVDTFNCFGYRKAGS
ncbi:MAG: MaoC family dehydratase [Halioglobus sp.]